MAGSARARYIQYYTNGSAARKLEIAMPVSAPMGPKAKRQKRKAIYVDPIATLGIVVAALMLILMVVGFARLQRVNQEVAVMESYVATLRRENAALEKEFMTGFDANEVERLAKGLGMIPQEQAQRVSVSVAMPQEAAPDGVWQTFLTRLSSLFA